MRLRASDRQGIAGVGSGRQRCRGNVGNIARMNERNLTGAGGCANNPLRLDRPCPVKGIDHKPRRLHERKWDATLSDRRFTLRCQTPVPTFCSLASNEESFTSSLTPATFAACAAASSRAASSGPELSNKMASAPQNACRGAESNRDRSPLLFAPTSSTGLSSRLRVVH